MAFLAISPDAVSVVADRMQSVAAGTASSTPAVAAIAQDPVSVAVARTLASRIHAINTLSATATAISAARGTMLHHSAAMYLVLDTAGQAALGDGASAAVEPTPSPPVDIPSSPPPLIVPTAIPTAPTDGRTIAALIHTGADPTGMLTAADSLTSHAAALSDTATAIQAAARDLDAAWPSDSGQAAAARLTELAAWYTSHAEHARAAASAIDIHVAQYRAAVTAIPRPEQFDDNESRLQAAVRANASPGSLGRFNAVIAALQAQRAHLHSQSLTGYAAYQASAADPALIGEPLTAPPHPHTVQAAGYDVPLSPADRDPPHGKDPRYWIDLDRVVHVPPGQPAPYGTIPIGPGLYYPDPGFPGPSGPAPAKHPLDLTDITRPGPGDLGPPGYQQLAPDVWVPDPTGGYQPVPPWTPRQPVDVRDIVHVPDRRLAPWGYVEYLPGWFAPGSALTNTASTAPR